MPEPAPLAALLFSVSTVYIAARVYQRFYPYRVVEAALEVVARYRELEEEARSGSKRAAKKLRLMEPEYGRARRLLFRSFIFKFALLMLTYTLAGALVLAVVPYAVVPFHLPPFTVIVEGSPVMPGYYLHFLGFLYGALLFRELFT